MTPAAPTSSTKATEIWDKAIDLATPLGTFIIVVVAVALILILLIVLICVCVSIYRSLTFFIIRQGKSERSDWFFLGRDFAFRTISVETVISCVFFLFSKADKLKTSMVRVPYNKLLTNLASSSRTGEYWPSVVFGRTSLRSVRTATTSGQYSPVRPSRSVSKRLVLLAV